MHCFGPSPHNRHFPAFWSWLLVESSQSGSCSGAARECLRVHSHDLSVRASTVLLCLGSTRDLFLHIRVIIHHHFSGRTTTALLTEQIDKCLISSTNTPTAHVCKRTDSSAELSLDQASKQRPVADLCCRLIWTNALFAPPLLGTSRHSFPCVP